MKARWVVAALAGAGLVRVLEALRDAWSARTDEPAPPRPAPIWAAYSGFRDGTARHGARLVLFGTRSEAVDYAERRGLYVAEVPLGARVFSALSRQGVAPVIPWPTDRPP